MLHCTSARSLIWRSPGCSHSSLSIHCGLLRSMGAIDPSVLAGQSGTALVPLADKFGPLIYLLGSSLVFLGIGVGSIVTALGLFCLVKEWLPKASLASFAWSQGAGYGSQRGQFWLSASPVVGVFAYVEWLLLTGKQSFTSPLSFLGVLAAPLIAGVFPLLLLVASRARRQADAAVSWLARESRRRWWHLRCVCGEPFCPWIFHLAGPVERFVALAIGVGVLALPIVLIRTGAFSSRTVIELRQEADPDSEGSFAISPPAGPSRPMCGWNTRNTEPFAHHRPARLPISPHFAASRSVCSTTRRNSRSGCIESQRR